MRGTGVTLDETERWEDGWKKKEREGKEGEGEGTGLEGLRSATKEKSAAPELRSEEEEGVQITRSTVFSPRR